MTHFCETYGFSTASVLVQGSSAMAVPSARHIAAVESLIREKGLPAIFITGENHRALATRIAGDLGVPVHRLHVDGLTPGDGPATYAEMMRTNAVILSKALGESER